jgi:single-strand DNA-binding protein
MSLNVCTFTGRLGRDAESKYLPTGTAVLEFSIAVDTGFGDKRRSFWLKCAMFGDRGPKLAQYLVKGQQVAVSGEFDPRQYQAKDGSEKISLELRISAVELIGGKNDAQQSQPEAATKPAPKPPSPKFDDDDDVPF